MLLRNTYAQSYPALDPSLHAGNCPRVRQWHHHHCVTDSFFSFHLNCFLRGREDIRSEAFFFFLSELFVGGKGEHEVCFTGINFMPGTLILVKSSWLGGHRPYYEIWYCYFAKWPVKLPSKYLFISTDVGFIEPWTEKLHSIVGSYQWRAT